MGLAVPRTQNDTAFPAQLAAERIEFNTGCDFRHRAVELYCLVGYIVRISSVYRP